MQVADDEDYPFAEAPWSGPDEPPDNVHVLPSAHALEVSEDAIALAFTREFGSSMRYDHHAGRWFQWSSTHWRRLDVPAALHYAREIGRRLGSGKKTICKASVARGAETFAQADPEHAVLSNIWDADPWLLGTPKGTLNLKTGKMHQPRPSDFITKLAGCNPDSREPVLWMKFLADATRGDAQMSTYLQRVAGYCLTGLTTEHALFFIYGPGGNGKSVFLNTLVNILGDYATNAPMDTFTSSKFNGHPTDLAMLKGARMVTASETEEGRAWAEARVKALTGGDPITARFMRQDFFTYQPQFKLLFAGNHQPALHGVDTAMRRRFNMLPFIFKPAEPDYALEEKLREEAPRILGWALRGCLDWQLHGLGKAASVIAATDEYFEEQDLFGTWVEDRCETGAEMWDLPAILFKSWSAYARASGEDPGSMVTFSAKLKKHGCHPRKSAGIRSYRGIRVRSEEPEIGY
jgi:putative DNA primase/helicase